jgi:hypothetical protein
MNLYNIILILENGKNLQFIAYAECMLSAIEQALESYPNGETIKAERIEDDK